MLGLCLFVCDFNGLQAQQGFFNFTPPSPSVYPVLPYPDCAQTLAGAGVMPTVSSNIGAVITASVFDSVASGFSPNDLWTAPTLNLIVVWYVADNQGHTANFTFSISFVDNSPPVLNNTPPPAESYASIVQVPPPPNVTANDCTPVMLTFVQSTPPDTCLAGSFTRTWTAKDTFNNVTTFTQTITIAADVLPPVISFFPQNGSAPCEQLATAYPAWLAQQMSLFQAADASGIKSYTNNAPPNFPPGCTVPLTVVFRATDNCNLFSTATAVFSTSDNKPPTVLAPAKDTVAYCSPSNNHLTRLGAWIQQRGYSNVIDSCSGPVTYIMRIGGMNKDSAGVVAEFLASFANGCGTQQIGSQTYNKVRGKISVDFFATDACGNSAFVNQATFGAIDTLPPVITGSNTTEQCGGGNDNANLQAWINAHGNAVVTDDCSGFTWTNFSYATSDGQNGNGVFNAGPYPQVQAHNCAWWADVTFRATDDCGNSAAITLRFQIVDTQAPVIAGHPDTVTLSCANPVPTLSPAFVTDNCDTSMTLAYAFTVSDSLCPGSYTMNVTWSATDDCGNTGTATQKVLVRDTNGPVFTLVPPNVTFRCDTFVLPPFPTAGVDITATDQCSGVTSIVAQDVSQQNPNPATCGHYTYNIIRTFTATDACGNTSTASQLISVIDNLGPAPGGLLDTTMTCDAQPFPTPPPAPVDACSGPTALPVFVNDVISNGPCDDAYIIIRNWQAEDVCGNTSIIPQNIHVVDTVAPTLSNIPPDVTVECNAIPVPPDASTFNATDNCDETVLVTMNDTEIRNPNTADCNHWTNYLIRREWTATDNCGNARTYTQNISVQDNTGPVIQTVPSVTLPAAPGLCSAMVGIPAPISFYDVCTSQKSAVMLKDTSLLVNTSGGPNNTTPVDTVVFQWSSPNFPPDMPALDPVTLKIFLDIADAEGPTEFFRVYGENGFLIGQTNPNSPPVQCGNSITTFTIPVAQFNDWLTDGELTLTLAPNGTGSDAINALATCAGGRARAELTYQFANPQLPVTLQFSLDGNAPMPYPPSGPFTLDAGTHTVTYTAIDCAGNSSTATTVIEVIDVEPPTVIPPAPSTFYVGQNNCAAIVTLPFPTISDNCDVSGKIVQSSASLPVIFENDPNAGLIPKDIFLTITGLVPNAISNGTLTIRHRGDNDNAPGGEFFRVFDEGNNFLSITSSGTAVGQCSLFHETVINVTANQINAWAAGNGTTSIKLEANDDAGNFTDFIDPCDALLPDMTDGISRVQAVLEYSFAVVAYEIRNSNDELVRFGTLIGNQTTDTLPPGTYTVKYRTNDASGLEGMASFSIMVLDTVRPVAVCQSLTIQVNPSGLPNDTYILQPSEVDNGSWDNCSGTALSFQLSQTDFVCSQAGNNFNVTMTVTDAAGNSSSCSALVSVITTILQPTYDPVCEGGTLRLYANPPTTASTYSWSGPNGFSSNLQNPTLPALIQSQGTYCVTVTGLTGCTATGCVTVMLVTLPDQPIISANKVSFCAGENIVLATPTYAGQNVSYQWFLDTLPGGPVLLGTTMQPIFTISQPAVGAYRYFVRVSADNCVSVNSNLLTATVYPIPPAAVNPNAINLCQCEPLTLNSTTPPQPGLTYAWTGPSGYNSNAQSPLVTNCANPSIHTGIYTLITQQNNCFSAPVTVSVNVGEKPATPQLTGATKVCVGATVTLICTEIQNVNYYEWQSPSFVTVTTQINSLVLNDVMVADSGVWRVRVFKQGCFSDWSAPILVEVEEYPTVVASANTPLCQGGPLQLSASSNIPLPSDNWAWYGPGGWTFFGQPNATRNPAVAGTYMVIGRTKFGCPDTSFVNVTVIDPPVITSVTHTAPVCADGSSAVLQAVTFSDNPPLTYSWTGPGGFMSSAPMPVIPGITAAQNGTYNLVVMDAFGCVSAMKSTTVSIQDPPITPILAVTPPVVCAGADVTISITNANQYPPTTTIYTWFKPNGDTSTTQPFIIIPSVQTPANGNYFNLVTVTGCISDTSAPVNLVVNPIPNSPVVTANTPLCEGDTLKLSTPLVFNATYSWSGPAGTVFIPSANVRNPIIPNINANHAGNYAVTITVNGCSASGEGVNVQVIPRPKQPIIKTPIQDVCLDQAGAILTIQVTDSSQVPGAQYTWYYAPTQTVLSGPGFPIAYQTTDFGNFNHGLNGFYVIASKDGCSSLPSATVQVRFDTIPNINPLAGQDMDACASAPIQLNASNPTPATGFWTQLTTFPGIFDNASSPTAKLTGVIPGVIYQLQWTLSNGGCKNYANDTVFIKTFAPETATVIDSLIQVCYATTVQLNAVQGINVDGYWTQPPGQEMLTGFHIVDPLDPKTEVDSLADGNTNILYFWNLDNGACGISTATVTIRNFGSRADGGADQVLCRNDSCTTLIAQQPPTGESGLWYSNDPTLVFSNPTSHITSVCNLKRGANTVIWMTNNGFCGPQSYDTVQIVYDLQPTAVPDEYSIGFGTVFNFNVLLNDILPQQYSVTVEQPPSGGQLTELAPGLFTYRPNVNFAGEDLMIYKVCNLVCPTATCSTAIVRLNVGTIDECPIFNVITPNDDSVNDFLFIPCIDTGETADNEVTIFNQWGDVVYHAQPYDNNNPWRGQYKGQDLPVGTYFYVIKFNGQVKPKAGFLQLQR
ncbi:MAG: gliding motility-associated C-terminal domain-containing protein [Saprospiraceae bacterium]|nr:gliding motility-associated C-terminal domain-containing protein [Saprospiraceae bacterium]